VRQSNHAMKTSATESNTMPSVDEAIPNEWARNYVTCSIPGVFLAPAYIDINDGNVTDGILFSQIMYWHKPNSEGQVRLSHKRNGFYWLTKSHRDWFRETRIRAETAREALYRI